MSNGFVVLRPTMRNYYVGLAQEQLNMLGYDAGYVDNVYGNRTAEAVRRFQAFVGLPQTGEIEFRTWRRLFGGRPLPPLPVPYVVSGAEADNGAGADAGAGASSGGSDSSLPEMRQVERYIRVSLGRRQLQLLENTTQLGAWPVGIGKPATPTPTGTFSILNAAMDPGGPFGTRWLGVTENGIGIHGTNAPWSIGGEVSNGCIRMYNSDVEALFDQVWVGMRVVIAADGYVPGQVTQTYVVQPGDTLWLIGQRFGVPVGAIITANNLTSTAIYPGQVLIIPAVAEAPPPPPPVPGTIRHVVQAGETLFSLAQRYGTTVEAIMAANRLTTTTIYVGQTLNIPVGAPASPSPRSTRYTVQPGDTLYLIAQRFGATAEAIMAANGLTSTTIYPGQVLIIP